MFVWTATKKGETSQQVVFWVDFESMIQFDKDSSFVRWFPKVDILEVHISSSTQLLYNILHTRKSSNNFQFTHYQFDDEPTIFSSNKNFGCLSLTSFLRCKMFCTSGFHLSTWLSTLGGSCSSHLSILSYYAALGVSGYPTSNGHCTLATWCRATWSFSRGLCHGGTTGRCGGDLG